MKSYEYILEAFERFVKPPPKAKFQAGDKVKILGGDDPSRFVAYHGKKRASLVDKEGTVIGYDYRPGSYSKFLIQLSDGTKEAIHSHFLVPAKTTGFIDVLNKVVQLGPPTFMPSLEVIGKQYLTQLQPFGYKAADEETLAQFKSGLMKSSPFQNNLIKGQRSDRSSFYVDNLKIHVIGYMRLYPTAPKVDTINSYPEHCLPVFDKKNPVFYLWYANTVRGVNFDEPFLISFPRLVSWKQDNGPATKEVLDKDFDLVQVMYGQGIQRTLKLVEHVASGKKLSVNSDYYMDVMSMFRIANMQSVKDIKGVSDQDFDALMGL